MNYLVFFKLPNNIDKASGYAGEVVLDRNLNEMSINVLS